MNDSETREVLVSLCELLKIECEELDSLRHEIVGLYEAVRQELPKVEQKYKPRLVVIEQTPGIARILQRVDALLEQLRTEEF